MSDEAERKVFDMVEQGQITAEEALRLINAMGSDEKETENELDVLSVEDTGYVSSSENVEEVAYPKIPAEELKRMNRLKKLWFVPFGFGLLIMTLGALWLYSAFSSNGFGVGFWLAWIPFISGIFIVAISFQTSRSVWLHVRIKQAPGERPQKIVISLPMPLSLTRWFLSTFGKRIPGLKDQPVDEYSDILENLSPESPFYVHVNEDDGEEVEVFIG
jgi:polyhydroxyalkanoate synthesis regulator phasin